MAIYGCRVHIVSRTQGHSAVAASAYRARAELADARTGQTHDYRKAYGGDDLIFAGIYAPKNAPEWAQDREALWNAAEARETRKDSRLARDFQLDLPHELSPEQNRYLVQDWVKENFTRHGYVADVAIHKAHSHGDARNVHAHIMVPTRRIDADGFAALKDDALNSTEQLQAWRANWARHLAHHLDRHGHGQQAERMEVGHLRLDKQRAAALKRGDLEWAEQLDREPQMHYGKAASAMERRGVETDKGAVNRAIAAECEERVTQRHAAPADRPQPDKLLHDAETARGAYGDMRSTHDAVYADREAELAAVRAGIAEAWQAGKGDVLEFAIALGDRGLTLAETKRGRFVAVDSRGDWHRLDPEALGLADGVLHARLSATFGKEGSIQLPTTAELRDAIRAENATRWHGAEGPDRSGAYDDLDTERIARQQGWLSDRAEWRSQVIAEQRERLAGNRTVQAIDAAWQAIIVEPDLDRTLADTLRERDLLLARVTGEEAAQSRREQIAAQLAGNKQRSAWTEGDFVAVNRSGGVYRLNATTIHAEAEDITDQLAFAAARAGQVPSVTNARLFWQEDRMQAKEDRTEQQRQARAAKLGELEDVQALRAAWKVSDSMGAFVEAIESQGFTVGRATAEDAARSHYDATVAQRHDADRHLPVFAEGELVAFTARGWAYRLNAATLDHLTVDRRLAGYIEPLPDFTEAREIAWQMQPERHRSEPLADVAWGRFGDGAGKFNSVAMNVMQDAAGAIEGVFGFFDRFFFGGGPQHAVNQQPELQSKARMTESDEYRYKLYRMEPQVRARDPDVPRHIYGLDPEIIEEIRRMREAEQKREHERRRGR